MNPKMLKRKYRKEYLWYKALGAPDNWILQTMERNRRDGVVAITLIGEPWKKSPRELLTTIGKNEK